jgi:RNase H-fold protein (predicted Holliday junction resolvase)
MQVKMFVEQLQKTGRFGCLNYTYWDERLTTRAVESMLKPLKIHPLQMKHMMDKFAAVGILLFFLFHLLYSLFIYFFYFIFVIYFTFILFFFYSLSLLL